VKALISVYDKTGIVELARRLQALGAELVSTGGTARALQEAGLPVRQVSELTGSPEILDGRVKTLHPAIHGAILARRDLPAHQEELARRGIQPIDVVVVNLYPFEATVSRAGVSLEEALENIDIGGPTLLRAAAKNHPWVTVLADPADYGWVVERLGQGGPTAEERRRLAAKAFQHVALYDTLIARWLRGEDSPFSEELTLGLRKVAGLRYGENPHQQAALYAEPLAAGGIVGAAQLHGKELSFNNILDADAAWAAVTDFAEPTAVIIKHTNPCGLASHPDQAEAYRRAHAGDPVSAYGGIAGFNRAVTAAAAEAMRGVFYEVVVAPAFEPQALELLRKRRDLRILQAPPSRPGAGRPLDLRRVAGGALVQTADALEEDPSTWRCATQRHPTEAELVDLAFAWRAVKHVKSNAITLVKAQSLVGMGAGQPNRVTSVHLALRAAGERARGSVLASDAFFPFPDGVELAGQGGITAVAQPGGSIRDVEVIAAADAARVAMLFTGVRHFRH
jgi:phosphoribosylaminoimidazolecarboxamide formyltransferase/IMP cyclohydrolase